MEGLAIYVYVIPVYIAKGEAKIDLDKYLIIRYCVVYVGQLIIATYVTNF